MVVFEDIVKDKLSVCFSQSNHKASEDLKYFLHGSLLLYTVQFLINAIIKSTNHMAVASMHLGVWFWSIQSPELQTECQNGKER